MQASLKGRDAAFARALREQVEKTGGYFEGDVAMVKSESGLDAFEAKLMAALNRVAQHPPKVPPPRTSGLPTDAVLAAEESNNRLCLSARASLGL